LRNLNALFNTSSQPVELTASQADQTTILFKRPRSSNWQVRFKLPSGTWHAVSTGHADLASAKPTSIEIQQRTLAQLAVGQPIFIKTFGEVAREELLAMSRAQDNHRAPTTFKDYTFAINKYLIPFFDRTAIADINDETIDDFSAWREAAMGKKPKASTLRNHASAYNRVITLARRQGLIGQDRTFPDLPIAGELSQARPAFSQPEIDDLLAFMADWELGGRLRMSRLMRRLCRSYVEFLLYTGIRHGTEARALRWRHLQWHMIGQQRYLRVWVSGKTGPRYLIAKHQAIPALERLARWQALGFAELDGVIKARLDRLVFAYPDGGMPYQMEGVFRTLMRDSGLALDTAGRNRTLYSLRHTYATFALADGIPIHTLARQMGTSVGMIERHYSKLTPMLNAERLA
jgi:integrase